MKITIRTLVQPEIELDVTEVLISAVAGEIWRVHKGNDELNWIEAEDALQLLFDSAQSPTAGSKTSGGVRIRCHTSPNQKGKNYDYTESQHRVRPEITRGRTAIYANIADARADSRSCVRAL